MSVVSNFWLFLFWKREKERKKRNLNGSKLFIPVYSWHSRYIVLNNVLWFYWFSLSIWREINVCSSKSRKCLLFLKMNIKEYMSKPNAVVSIFHWNASYEWMLTPLFSCLIERWKFPLGSPVYMPWDAFGCHFNSSNFINLLPSEFLWCLGSRLKCSNIKRLFELKIFEGFLENPKLKSLKAVTCSLFNESSDVDESKPSRSVDFHWGFNRFCCLRNGPSNEFIMGHASVKICWPISTRFWQHCHSI